MSHRVASLLGVFCLWGMSSIVQAAAKTPVHAPDLNALRVRSEFLFEEAPFPERHASTIVEAEPGTLMVTFYGGMEERAPDMKIYMCRGMVGADDQTQWTSPVVVAQHPGTPCWGSTLFKTRAGELLLFYRAGKSPLTWSGFVKRSRDVGRTWSKPEIFPAGIIGPVRSKPLELPDGRLICGSSVESYGAWACWIEITPDAGRTWTKHGPIVVPGQPLGIIQPTVFQASKGRLKCLCRPSAAIGRICESTSTDGGLTWSPAKPTDLPNPNSGITTVQLADGRILLIYNHSKPFNRAPLMARWPLNVAVSEDGGDTFRPGFKIESEPPGPYAYPEAIQASDGRVHVTYTWKRERIKHVSFDPRGLTARSGASDASWGRTPIQQVEKDGAVDLGEQSLHQQDSGTALPVTEVGEVVTNSIGMKLKPIGAGTFRMGSNKGKSDETPIHHVTISQPFKISVCEVTQSQYKKVMSVNPSRFKGAHRPVEMVSWHDAQAFCHRLSQMERVVYRLPTEAQWEYAFRAGATTDYFWGDRFSASHAWFAGNTGEKTQEVGTNRPNQWGLWNMAGNVREWCRDWYAKSYPAGGQVDPQGPSNGYGRVVRGASCFSNPRYCRCSSRHWAGPDIRSAGLGFRVVAEP